MASKEISIIISAKNAIAAGIKSAEKSLRDFADSAVRIGEFFAKSMLAAGAAVVAFGSKAVMAFAESEKAQQQLKSAFIAYGEETENNVKRVNDFAAAISKQTGVEDDSIVAMTAKLKLYGIQTSQLEQATKATIGLVAAGMDEEAAMKAVASAAEGNFESLTRYIPALKSATDESEKARIVNEFITRGYETQKGTLDTIGGQWSVLKNNIGNAVEEMGGAIAKNDAVKDAMKRAGSAVEEFTRKFKEWVDSGGVENTIAGFKIFAETARTIFTKAMLYGEAFFGGIYDGAKAAFEYLKSVVTSSGAVIADLFTGNFADLKTSVADLGKALSGEFVKTTGRFDAVAKKLVDEEERYSAAVARISKEQLDNLKKNGDERVDATKKNLDQIIVAEENAAKKKERLEKEKSELVKKLAKEESDLKEKQAKIDEQRAEEAKKQEIKKLEQNVAELDKQNDKARKVADKSIKDIIAEKKANADQLDADAKERERVIKLRKKQGRGTKLSKADAEFLNAFDERLANENAANMAQGALARAKQQLDEAQKKADEDARKAREIIDTNNLDNIRIAIQSVDAQLNDAITRS